MLTITVEIDGLERKMNMLANQAGDLTKPLRIFGSYMRKRAIERYKAQDFAPLAPSTVAHRAQKGVRALGRKLALDVRKARARQDAKLPPRSMLERVLGTPRVTAAIESRGLQNRLAVMAEFQRSHGKSSTLTERAGLKALTMKQKLSLGGREDRAVAKAVGGPVLGRLPRTLTVEPEKFQVTVASRTHQKWSDAHNAGDTVGHGAKLPKRETLKIESGDLDVLAAILRDHLLLPITEG